MTILSHPAITGIDIVFSGDTAMAFLSEHYLVIRHLHVLTAVLSIVLLCYRFLLFMRYPAALQGRWIKVLPHVNDTLLFFFAILLCIAIQQAPVITPWLSEKVTMVVLYIFAAMAALKWAKSRPGRVIWFIIALFLFASIANIAVNKTPAIF